MSTSGPILVTGASGFIGRRCVQRLLSEGHDVRALVLPSETVDGLWPDEVHVVRGDISCMDSVEEAADGVRAVVHLAALVGDFGDDALHQSITVQGTHNVLSATGPDVRVVVISSVVYYGSDIRTETCTEERAPGKALGPYSRAKQAQERVARSFIENGRDVVIVRPTNVYGAGSGPWVDDATTMLLEGGPALVGTGESNAGLVHVDNVVDIIYRSVVTPEARGRTYNACDELDVSWKQYFGLLAEIVGADPPKAIPRWVAVLGAYVCEFYWKVSRRQDRPLITHEALNLVGSNFKVPSDRARAELGYVTRVNFKEGLKEVREYLVNKG